MGVTSKTIVNTKITRYRITKSIKRASPTTLQINLDSLLLFANFTPCNYSLCSLISYTSPHSLLLHLNLHILSHSHIGARVILGIGFFWRMYTIGTTSRAK